jgi:hypothetical protein
VDGAGPDTVEWRDGIPVPDTSFFHVGEPVEGRDVSLPDTFSCHPRIDERITEIVREGIRDHPGKPFE